MLSPSEQDLLQKKRLSDGPFEEQLEQEDEAILESAVQWMPSQPSGPVAAKAAAVRLVVRYSSF